MKRKFALPTLGLLSCSAILALAQPAQAKPQCTMSNVAGDYGYTSTGSVVSPPVGSFAAVGRVMITSAGTFTGEQSTSVGGNVADETITGSFAVNSDCTATAIAYIYRGGSLVRTTSFDAVWDSNRNEFRAIFRTPGTVVTMIGQRMFEDDE